MTDLSPDQQILNDMAAILGRIAPPGAEQVVFRGKLYDDFTEGAVVWVDAQGDEQAFAPADQPPMSTIADLLDLGENLQSAPVFSASPFTQFELRLTRAPDITLNTTNIPAEQSWPGLFMRALGDLTRDQALDLHIPEADWQAACR